MSLSKGWLMNPRFDMTLIFGVAGLALLGGWVSVVKPNLFPLLLFWDLWLLGTHHVIATFTRLCFDVDSFKQHKFLVLGLPVIVVAGTTAAALAIGPWIIPTTYLYWQWFHYTRQSYGIARVYQSKLDPKAKPDSLIIYLLPLSGILYRSYQNPGTFLGMELRCLPVPLWVVQLFFAASAAALVWWVIQEFREYRQGTFKVGYSLYMITHIAIFTVGYVAIRDINFGWLVLNIWHNAQYLMFVWMYNNKRFKDQIDPRHPFLSTLSRRKFQWAYHIVTLGITVIVYNSLQMTVSQLSTAALPVALVVYQAINFHHYIVDGIIWKVRQKPIRQTLDI